MDVSFQNKATVDYFLNADKTKCKYTKAWLDVVASWNGFK